LLKKNNPVPNTVVRPEHLPDFLNPPLNEVVLGVQFTPPKGYQQILAGEVWNLFRSEYSDVQEQSPVQPSFETFGLPQQSRIPTQLSLVTSAIHDRFWFLRPSGDELIQFQQDRLLHNWRKTGDETNEYPRFEYMAKRFESELNQFQSYIAGLVPQDLAINQCEVSYINHITSNEAEVIKASNWLRFVTFSDRDPETFAVSFREIIYDEEGKPQGRMICEASLGIKAGGQQIIVLTLTVRGSPKSTNIESALEFINMGRNLIVCRFTELTTDVAHKKWERIK